MRPVLPDKTYPIHRQNPRTSHHRNWSHRSKDHVREVHVATPTYGSRDHFHGYDHRSRRCDRDDRRGDRRDDP